jgi:hypothetical protein
MERQPDSTYDVIYIDGDHSLDGVTSDAYVSARKLKSDGVLVFNESGHHAAGSASVVVTTTTGASAANSLYSYVIQDDTGTTLAVPSPAAANGFNTLSFQEEFTDLSNSTPPPTSSPLAARNLGSIFARKYMAGLRARSRTSRFLSNIIIPNTTQSRTPLLR